MKIDASEKKQRLRIKPKVLFGFLIILSIAFAASFVTYKGFTKLSSTQEILSEPRQKLIKLNNILADIYEAESNIRTYTLTHDEHYLTLYFSLLININEKVDSLLILSYDNPVQSGKILYIQELLESKKNILNELLALKTEDQYSQFYHLALEEVEKIEPNTSNQASVITKTTITTTSKQDTVISRKPAAELDQGLFTRMKRWFSKPSEPKDTTITKLHVKAETKIDTLKLGVAYSSDSLLNEVVKILTQIKHQQQEVIYNISTKELELLRSDKQIMDQIRNMVSLLEQEELKNSFNQTEEAKEVVKSSTNLLIALGAAAFLMVLVFTLIIFRDITNANFYRSQLLEAKKFAEKLLKIKEEFLSNMSHEIRTPLSAIIGFSRMLKRSDLHESQNRFVTSLENSSQHLLHIVNDILDLSKIEGGYLKFEAIPFSPYDIAKETIETFAFKAKEKNISLQLHCQQELPITVVGDPFRLKQILFNLVSNAIKFTNDGGVILLVNHSEDAENQILFNFEVTDTGIGIEPEKVDSIFEQFTQVDSSTSRRYGGTGLGLTIVKKLTELQGGNISAHSELNKGTTFTLRIGYALGESRADLTVDEEALSNLSLPAMLKILVVDDDKISQDLIGEMLKTLGVSPTIIGNPKVAIEEAEANSFDVILSDIQMPGLSGFDLVKAIREHPTIVPTPVVIALTANSTIDNPSFYYDAGFDGVLIKPFDEIDLYNILAPRVNGNNFKAISKFSGLHNEDGGDYNLSDIIRFAGNNRDSVKVIVQSFIENSNANLNELKLHYANKNHIMVSEVAHRMKSAYRQLKAFKLADTLELLEGVKHGRLKGRKARKTLSYISKEVLRVEQLLKHDLENL
ncbi:MAG TPA: ATP-binding protein [Tenuifilaceae bacterium]|nr:ATP-binding protein [Tenuifilaceae bacterium]